MSLPGPRPTSTCTPTPHPHPHPHSRPHPHPLPHPHPYQHAHLFAFVLENSQLARHSNPARPDRSRQKETATNQGRIFWHSFLLLTRSVPLPLPYDQGPHAPTTQLTAPNSFRFGFVFRRLDCCSFLHTHTMHTAILWRFLCRTNDSGCSGWMVHGDGSTQ